MGREAVLLPRLSSPVLACLRRAAGTEQTYCSQLFWLSARPGLALPKSPPGHSTPPAPGPGRCGKQPGPRRHPFSSSTATAHWERPLGRVELVTFILPARSFAAPITTAPQRKGSASDLATGQSGGIREGQGVARSGIKSRKGGEFPAS